MNPNNTSAKKFADKTLYQSCIDNFNSIINGTDGEDGQDGNSVTVDQVSNTLATTLRGDSDFIGNVARVVPAGKNGKSAAEIWCESHIIGADDTRVLTPAQMMSTASVLSTPQIDSTRNLFVNLQACLNAVAANPGLMSGESAADQDFNKQNAGKNFGQLNVTAYTTHLNGFVGSLKGKNGASAATIWCKAHSKDVDGITPIALTPAQIIKSVIATGEDYIDSEQNLFASVDACEEVIAANPDLMSGESAADENLNNEIRAGDLQISEYIDDPEKFATYQSEFIPNMKNDLKGITWRPVVQNGVIGWQQNDSTSAPTSLNVNTTAVAAIKNDLNVASDASLSDALNTNAVAAVKNSIDSNATSLQAAIDSRATTKANTQVNTLSDTLLTAQDLINLVKAGVFVIDSSNNQLKITTDTIPAGSPSNYGSLKKLNIATPNTITVQCGSSGSNLGSGGSSGTGQQCPITNTQLISSNP